MFGGCGFTAVLLLFEQARQAEPVEIVTVLADSNFTFPSPKFYIDLEKDGEEGLCLATAFRRMLNILALPFSPAGSIGIISTQVSEICRRLRQCRQPQDFGHSTSQASVTPSRVIMLL